MNNVSHAVAPIALAVALDLALGEPSNRTHPVAWIGSALLRARRCLPTRGRAVPLLCGGCLMAAGIAVALALGLTIDDALGRMAPPLAIVAEAILLKTMFSIRGLARASRSVAEALGRGDLDGARSLASLHLVSRQTGSLDGPRVAAATIESVAENASDGVVAPLFYYGLCGLPGALAYRLINTADSIYGYRDPEREWLGKIPARLDDAANLIPARLTAALMILAAPIIGTRPSRAFRIWRRDAGQTASPNAGHPMSAAAGALGVELEKLGAYRLGEGQRLPDVGDIGRAKRLLLSTAALSLVPIVGLRILLIAL